MGATGDIQVWLRDRKVFSSQKAGVGGGVGSGREGGKEKRALEELYRFSGKKQGLRIRWKWLQMLAAFL